jgi:hypothetical protein
MGRPPSSPGGLADGMSVPDSGRHPTLDASIREAVAACQTIEGKRVTRSAVGACKMVERGGLQSAS